MSYVSPEHTIYVVGDIDHASYLRFDRKLSRLEELDRVGVEICIVLSSDGGDAMVALAYHDRIKLSPNKISIVATGLVASAAALILAAGKNRFMTRSSWVMVHDDTPGDTDIEGKRVCEVEKNIKHLRRVEDQWNRLMAESTTTSAEGWDALHRNETYLTAEECLRLGLIEEII